MSACSFGTSTNSNADSGANTPPAIDANADPAGTPNAGAGESGSVVAEALVTDLYKQHNGKNSPFFQTKNRSLVDKFFNRPLSDLIWQDANTSSGEVGAIDADPLYNAQDTEIKNFAVGSAVVADGTATVPVNFTNFGKKQTITFALKQVGGEWKIDNILYGKGDSLLKWLRGTYSAPAKNASPTGEFEGKFRVGDTTCTVKPVKMAFEVRWAKGSGVEVFFAEGDNTFASTPDKGQPNRFVFDDENYNTGTFYRADGKIFPVKRANNSL